MALAGLILIGVLGIIGVLVLVDDAVKDIQQRKAGK